ncbi:alpha/beta hydrolase family protein [Tengunoibacter tsumagoiensis]|uniref:Alpha/beta hydrolase n=1 Tax=Tengunoibacter tsumagoiensis TaxID=2014871 RepID=A0A402A872_9CHLR|nr:hypothetical protein [Tengunoibacter tsumagoiensis]GCE15289.1 hypothetical protein KTT_51480 [Tengunoibacter tsumagoiensis]
MERTTQLRLFIRLCGLILTLGAASLTAWYCIPHTYASASTHAEKKQRCASANASYSSLVHQFDYNAKASLQVKEISVTQQDEVSIHDITYVSEDHIVSAYLVVPTGQGPFAGALFMHWLDDSPTGNRDEFLQDAITLAHKGTISLLPQGFYPWITPPTNSAKDCEATIQQTIALRRGLDLLVSTTTIDPQRIAFVGHDYGAMYGSILAGIDKRIKAAVLMAPTARFSNWNVPFFLDTLTARQRLDYTVDTASIDPITLMEYVSPTPVLFQYGRLDKYVSLADLNNLVEVAKDPTTIKLYATDHALADDLSHQDRLNWLETELKLP